METTRVDARGAGRHAVTPRVAVDLAIRRPKTLPADVTVGVVREQLEDDHVHLVLLTDGTTLVGTVAREDLVPDLADSQPALLCARLEGRTVPPMHPAGAVLEDLRRRQARRVAVVSSDGTLLGLVCLNRRGTGVCSDEGVAARAAERARIGAGPGG